MSDRPTCLALLGALLLATPGVAGAQAPPADETVEFFARNCASCHTIGGGPLTGPDLKDVTQRRDTEWLVRFILDPKGVIDSGDPYAVELLRAARGVYMQPVPGVDRALATRLIELVAAESALEKSRFAGLSVSDRPLTDADAERGDRLFRGAERFASGAPACAGCHTVGGLGGFGGGRLGPDLGDVYARLEGRKALAAWLSAPPSAVMQPVFRTRPLDGEEILALVAFLKRRAEAPPDAAQGSDTLEFVLAGCGGSAALLLLLDFLWRRRYRATRRPLLTSGRRGASAGTAS